MTNIIKSNNNNKRIFRVKRADKLATINSDNLANIIKLNDIHILGIKNIWGSYCLLISDNQKNKQRSGNPHSFRKHLKKENQGG